MSKKTYTELSQVLRRALKLVRGGWTKHASARDKWWHPVGTSSPRACKFCATGAIGAATPRSSAGADAMADACRFLSWHLPSRPNRHNTSVQAFNDARQTKKADVVALFERAIAALRGKKGGRK